MLVISVPINISQFIISDIFVEIETSLASEKLCLIRMNASKLFTAITFNPNEYFYAGQYNNVQCL